MTQPIFNQPGKIEKAASQPMNELGQEIATSVRETFYAYNNRKTTDNRTAQIHLGPSEIGTPCDRRLVMSLLGLPAVNPGGDGWAAWVGTQGHAGMAAIYEWADAGSGRYAVETPLVFPSELVPRGTGDLLDRMRAGGTFIDWKFMGKWSLNKLRQDGPSATYRVQIHTYAYGAKQRGEKVSHVAIVGLPREGASLDDMYVWTEKFDSKVALDALKRVDRLQHQINKTRPGWTDAQVAEQFETAEDCRFCAHYLRGSKSLENGCSGVK